MSQTVITEAFEQWKAQQAANGQAVVLDEFVFANVPNLDVNAPIDRTAGMPAAAQIVYRQAVEKTGLVNENAVVYSVTLGADVGDFSFNWIGLTNKATGKLAMVVHAPLQSKVKNANGQQGNVLTRSFLMEYNGAEAQTLISTPAETWQIDFTARLAGMDEALRLANLDIYGAGAFFDTGFLVNKTGTQYFVTAGAGYVGGLRAALAANANITVTTKPVKVWADVSYHGTLTSAYQTDIKFTLATTLANYAQSGINHYVFALASIDANGVITDLRPKGSSLYLRRDKNLSDVADPVAALDTLNGVPKTRKINDKPLSADIALSPADVGALPAGGTAVAATKLATARKIAGVAFDGTADISLLPANVGALPAGGTAVAATKLATARKIAGVAFDGTADISLLPANVGALPAGGTAVAATKLATARKIAGVPFDGSADISLAAANIGGLGTAALRDVQTSNTDATSGRVMQVGAFGIGIGNGSVPFLSSIYDIPCSGEYNAFGSGTDSPTVGIPDDSGNTRFAVYAGNVYASQYLVTLTSNVHFYVGFVHTANRTVAWSKFYNTSNKPSASDVGALPSGGTAVAADKLATARTIAGVSFNGTANIAIPAGNVGAYTKAEADARYSLKNTASKAANGWFKDASSGMIFQWGNNSTVGSSVTLPTSFPNACASFVVTDRGNGKVAFAGNASQNTFTVYGGGNNLTYNWMAIGY